MLQALKGNIKHSKLVEKLKQAAEENAYDIYNLPVFRTYFTHDFDVYYKRLLAQYLALLAFFIALVCGWVFMVLRVEEQTLLTQKVGT